MRLVGARLGLVLVLAATGCSPAQEAESPRTPVAASESATVGADVGVDPLWSDALKTLGRHQEGDTIPESEWAPAVRALNPVRVYVQGLNVVIVLEESATTESGSYVVSGLSSKMLQQGDGGLTFSPDPETQRAARRIEIYDFTREMQEP